MIVVNIFTFVLLIALVLGQESNENSIFSLIYDHEEFKKVADSLLEESSIIHENVCDLSEENWETVKSTFAPYCYNLHGVSLETGSFNYTYIDAILSPEQFDDFVASQCDEEHNLEKDMDSKIAAVMKGYLLRVGNCGEFPDKEEACKQRQQEGKIHENKRSHGKGSNKNRSHSKK